jgi:hypothetical protein
MSSAYRRQCRKTSGVLMLRYRPGRWRSCRRRLSRCRSVQCRLRVPGSTHRHSHVSASQACVKGREGACNHPCQRADRTRHLAPRLVHEPALGARRRANSEHARVRHRALARDEIGERSTARARNRRPWPRCNRHRAGYCSTIGPWVIVCGGTGEASIERCASTSTKSICATTRYLWMILGLWWCR